MSDPWVPPYFGSWNDLVNALLHNPFLGGGQDGGGHGPRPMMAATVAGEGRYRMGPQPEPWFASTATALLMSAINLKLVASQLPEGQGGQLGHAADRALSVYIDEFC